MKIYLYLANKVLSFSIPVVVSGSFSFDENESEELKLINIESREGRWVLYSTSETSIVSSNGPISAVELIPNRYYNLKRKNKVYLIYVTTAFDNSYSLYSYSDDINFVVGNKNPNCNIVFSNPLINDLAYTITKMESGLTLKIGNVPVYVNDNIVKSQNILLRNGDKIDLYGFKVLVLNNLLAFNNPASLLNVNSESAKINQYSVEKDSEPVDVAIKDVDLYSKDEYFSKSPRIRRLIETKEIELSQPPKLNEGGEIPLILQLGPTILMGILSILRILSIISDITSGQRTFAQCYMQVAQAAVMLISALVWPILTRIITKRMKKRNKQILNQKYTNYLNEKRKELSEEEKLQRDILNENLLPVDRCLKIIEQGNINFWDKRIEQNDFLEVFVGNGSVKLNVNINYPKEGFTIDEDDLKKQTDAMVKEYEYINNVPVGYSLYKNKITALMGEPSHTYNFINNIILQLITYYTYEDLKIVVFTNDVNKEKWEYIKYLNHSFSNDKTVRFFSTNQEGAKAIVDFLNFELQNRIAQAKDEKQMFKPHYLIITDDFHQIRRLGFTKLLTELDANFGFSMIIMENKIGKLPSKCNNFISLTNGVSSILMNSFEKQEKIDFHDQINDTVDMMAVVKKLSNIPIEFEDGNNGLPESITFLEMEKVGKVEQLNILNRWQQNDSTQSLRAEVGVDEEGNLLYLDLHEKFHGPHGLIAGMTGSGKSEFIITYILSMAINYSPDDVSFILIDYKGGGLAGAFENKVTGITLPHLAGTITNLDKAEMDRTLVSIDSEVKRRQALFNEARDQLGESTIDIYKYQRFYKEGRLKEPCPHLFIICDEFAELKSQQPDFMDNLISVARIGRSLGIHLILATQKPSGVVNDQIWSNTKFRVCLKVQDASDSREMLKRPEAASLKQAGRFYLQVGYDEYFALGQSGWCGAKYYPSEKIIKQADKSINFIGDTGNSIKSIKAGNNMKIEAQGEQLAAIMDSIIKASKMTNKKATRLWLNNIDPVIITDDLEKKYNFEANTNDVTAIIGEYDAPEKQEQGLLTYSLMKDGNTLIYGTDEAEKEKLVNSIIYSLIRNYTAKNINIYAVDYGSESLRMFNGFPQIGGVVYLGEDDRFNNVFKYIESELKRRKKLLIKYGGSFENYNNSNAVKLPQILFILNNFAGISDVYNSINERIIPLARDSVRYGISILITCTTTSSTGRRLTQSFENAYSLHLTDSSDYFSVFNKRTNAPRDTFGRGLVNNDGVHEFQTASICKEEEDANTKLTDICNKLLSFDSTKAPSIPELPEVVTYDYVSEIKPSVEAVPIGVDKTSLDIVNFNFSEYPLYTIVSNKLTNINSFVLSLLEELKRIENSCLYFIDCMNLLPQAKKEGINYFADNLEAIMTKMNEQLQTVKDKKILYVIYNIEKLKDTVPTNVIEGLFNTVKSSNNAKIIICDSAKGIKAIEYDQWYTKMKNTSDGIWIGSGISEQQVYRILRVTKEMSLKTSNEYGYYLVENEPQMIKFINFYGAGGEKNEE